MSPVRLVTYVSGPDNGDIGAPWGTRTPVFAVRGRRPGPLDEGSLGARDSLERAAAQAVPRTQISLQASPEDAARVVLRLTTVAAEIYNYSKIWKLLPQRRC